MALLTTRQKQQLIGPVLIFLVVGGFVGAVWQGNPVAITVLVVLVLGVVFAVWWSVAKHNNAKKAAQARRDQERAAARAAIEKIKRLADPEQKTLSFQIPVMSGDTLESLTVRVMEYYAERGGSIRVSEAKAMAEKALETAAADLPTPP